jgi:hypothetical protein
VAAASKGAGHKEVHTKTKAKNKVGRPAKAKDPGLPFSRAKRRFPAGISRKIANRKLFTREYLVS